ncbi:MAG: hypothetical protein MJE68_24095 [Proteobacteria bacterium]|nr:hypothetical protein [Pseudomonadota bacterium]
MISPTTPLTGRVQGVVGIFRPLALKFCPGGGALAHAYTTSSRSLESPGLVHAYKTRSKT